MVESILKTKTNLLKSSFSHFQNLTYILISEKLDDKQTHIVVKLMFIDLI